MREHKAVTALLRQAESERRCAYGNNGAQRRALKRRESIGELVAPYPAVYAAAQYWNALNPPQQTLHVIRALALKHPSWVFAGLSAACAYGLEHAYQLHDGTISIASTLVNRNTDCSKLRRIYMNDIRPWTAYGIRVTSPERTLIDCGNQFEFPYALALFDSALRRNYTTTERIWGLLIQVSPDTSRIKPLLEYANPLSENGGESLMRGLIRQQHFAAPLLQVEFPNPDSSRSPYRVDFCRKLADGRIIVAEYDGIAKYADASNEHRASILAKLEYERRREAHLKANGVTAIIHVFYEDLIKVDQLAGKLLNAGVPKLR
ncbi:hypothetical protein [Bifidobacterium miconisargentati]|uniref:hypothetical protein n=1 Tax=Bifidobacterium miconisargentati TaxID=2834437 RepID=UPI001BDC1B87|nr:hypothetical protein [Bifidobacterium miconisargentati]MBW3090602.1 hypothetical protein [Bifidobacterium miconisargentati]